MAKNRFTEARGPSTRQKKVAEMIRRRLSEIFSRGEIHDPDLNRISITVGDVRVPPDLRVATAYVVPLGGEGQDDMLSLLQRNKAEIRRAVCHGLKLKFAPELRFHLDDTFDQLEATQRLMSQDAVRRDVES